MPETINDIMNELQGVSPYTSEIAERAYEAGKREAVTNKLLKERSIGHDEGYESGFREAAGDPSAWFVKDIDGNEMHIGDSIIDEDATRVEVMALGENRVHDQYDCRHQADKCKLAPKDTRDSLIEELTSAVSDWADLDADHLRGWATDLFDRIKAVDE